MATTKLPVINRSLTTPVWHCPNPSTSSNLSEQKASYIRHQIFDRPALSQLPSHSQSYELSQLPFCTVSENQERFVDNNFGLRKKSRLWRRKDQIQLSNNPMESSSIYNKEYQLKTRVAADRCLPRQSQLAYLFQSDPLRGPQISLYRDDFHGRRVSGELEPHKRVVTVRTEQPQTDYGLNYVRPSPSRVYLPVPVYKTPKAALDCDTSYGISFVRHPYCRQSMVAPRDSALSLANSAEQSGREAEVAGRSSTTYSADFVARERDCSLDALRIRQNWSSLTHTVPENNDIGRDTGQEFSEHRDRLFVQKQRPNL